MLILDVLEKQVTLDRRQSCSGMHVSREKAGPGRNRGGRAGSGSERYPTCGTWPEPGSEGSPAAADHSRARSALPETGVSSGDDIDRQVVLKTTVQDVCSPGEGEQHGACVRSQGGQT